MASTATVTAKIGPGLTATAVVLSDIRNFTFDCDGNSLSITLRNGEVKTFAGYTTMLVTKSGSNYTLTVS